MNNQSYKCFKQLKRNFQLFEIVNLVKITKTSEPVIGVLDKVVQSQPWGRGFNSQLLFFFIFNFFIIWYGKLLAAWEFQTFINYAKRFCKIWMMKIVFAKRYWHCGM